MRALTIEYPNGLNRRLRLISSEELEPAGAKTSPVVDFQRAFFAAGKDYGMVYRPPTGEDMGVITNLLKHYDAVTLAEYARLFWRGHSDGVRDHFLLTFRRVLPEIIREG